MKFFQGCRMIGSQTDDPETAVQTEPVRGCPLLFQFPLIRPDKPRILRRSEFSQPMLDPFPFSPQPETFPAVTEKHVHGRPYDMDTVSQTEFRTGRGCFSHLFCSGAFVSIDFLSGIYYIILKQLSFSIGFSRPSEGFLERTSGFLPKTGQKQLCQRRVFIAGISLSGQKSRFFPLRT